MAEATATSRDLHPVVLLDVEQELGAEVAEEELPLLRRHTVVPALHLPAAPWTPPPAHTLGSRPFALLVLEGLVTRSVALADRTSTQLLGPGDVLVPWSEPEGLVPAVTEWRINTATHVAVLDDRLLLAARRWPGIFRLLHERLACQTSRQAIHTAIAQLPRVDTRVIAILWHLAERFGRVTPTGVIVPLRLTHEALGHLIGAQRPTVTLALGELAESGAVQRTPEGAWLLREGTQVDLAPSIDTVMPMPAITTTRLPDVDPEAQHFRAAHPPEVVDEREIERLHERVGLLRTALPVNDEHVRRVLAESRAARDRSVALRRRMAAERERDRDRLVR